MIILRRPFPKSTIAQPFGANENNSYSLSGLKGHTGIDFGVPYGTPIPNVIDGAYCFAVLNKGDPNLMDYRAVFTLVDDGDYSYEISYGHFSDSVSVIGKRYNSGDTLAFIGNAGPVYTNGFEVTEAQKEAGSHAGSHLHFQVRKLTKIISGMAYDPSAKYVQEYGGIPGAYTSGVLQYGGFYYKVVDPDNGYNGCIDPEPFFEDNQPVVVPQLTPSDKVAVLAAQDQASGNTQQAGILWALVKFLKSFFS